MTIFSEISDITEEQALKELDALARQERPKVSAKVLMSKAGICASKLSGTYKTSDGRTVVVKVHTTNLSTINAKELAPKKRVTKQEVKDTETAQAEIKTTHLIDADGHELPEEV